MTSPTTKRDALQPEAEEAGPLFADWFDPIETALRDRVREFIETMISSELDAALARPRYARRPAGEGGDGVAAEVVGHRPGRRTRPLTGTFGATQVSVPRARIAAEGGGTVEWRSKALRAYQRRTKAAEALIASTYLAGTNTRRVRRGLAALFGGAVGKDVVSRTWRKIKTDWEAWNGRDLAAEPSGRLLPNRSCGCCRTDRAAAPRRHGRPRQARPEGHQHFPPGRPRRPLRRPEGAAGGQEHGRRERGGVAGAARRSGRSRAASARAAHRRWCARSGEGARRPLASRAGAAVHGPQAPEPPGARSRQAARGDLRRLPGHDLRCDRQGDRAAPQSLPAQVAAQVPGRRRQPGGGRRAALHLHPVADQPVEVGPNHQRHRAASRGIQAPDQDPDGAALGRDRRDAVLGAARIGSNHDAQS